MNSMPLYEGPDVRKYLFDFSKKKGLSYSNLLFFCFVTYKKNFQNNLTCARFFKNVNKDHFANAQMSIYTFWLFQSAEAPDKCTGPRVEGDRFPLQTPYRRAFYLNKTMQLSKPVHGLREIYLHEFLQTLKNFLE